MSIRVIDTATPAITKLAERFADGHAMHAVIAAALGREVKRTFTAKGRDEHNPFGVPSTFWLRMIDGTHTSNTATEAVVSVPYEAAARAYGATIRPTGGRKALAMPTAAESYGKSPRSFSDLVFAPNHGADEFGEGGETIGVLLRHTGPDSYQVLYRLVAKAVIPKDDAVLPTDDVFLAEIISDLAFVVKRYNL